jgi:peroxiredoxin
MKRKRLVIAGVALTGAIVAGYWVWPILMHQAAMAILESRAAIRQSRAAPDFTLRDANGGSVELAGFRGKVVLLNFWATWCGPCKVEIPWFTEFQKQYQAQGFTVVGVSMDEEGWKVVKPYIAEQNINYPIVIGNEAVNASYGGIESLPTTLLIDKDGRIAFIHSGLIDKREYQKEIVQLLGPRAKRVASAPPVS